MVVVITLPVLAVCGGDIMPANLDHSAVAAPNSFHGGSVRPLLEQGTPVHRFAQFQAPKTHMATDGPYRPVQDLGGNGLEVYDIKEGPDELRNFANSKNRNEIRERPGLEINTH